MSRRSFTAEEKKIQYENQHHVCPHCMKRYENISMMDGDHIVPYHPIPQSGQMNGPTAAYNLQMLCHHCNMEKSNKPFDKKLEVAALQKVYDMTPEEVAKLPEGGK